MTINFQRLFRSTLLVLCFAGLTACGSEEENNTSNNMTTNNSTTNNSTMTSNNMSSNATTNNTTMAPECTKPEDCPTDRPLCENGMCVAPPAQCEAEREACVPGEATNDGFSCQQNLFDAGDSLCHKTCTVPQQGQADPCGSGSFCVGLDGTLTAGADGYCVLSDCNNLLDTDSCEAVAMDNMAAYPNGSTCVALRNSTFTCFPNGMGTEGTDCETTADCAQGLHCFGQCTKLCRTDAVCDTANGQSCIGEDDANIIDANIGFCEVSCTPFSTGECPMGQGCVPINDTDGQCVDVGMKQAWETCDQMNRCGEGLICLTYQQATANQPAVSICHPRCDAAGTNPNGSCLDAAQEKAYVRFVHTIEDAAAVDVYVADTKVWDDLAFEQASDFLEIDAPTGQNIKVDIVDGGQADNSMPLLSQMVTNLGPNAARIVAVTRDAADPTKLRIVQAGQPRGLLDAPAGKGLVQVFHAAPDFSPVQIKVVTAGAATLDDPAFDSEEFSFDDQTGYLELDAGDYDVYVWDDVDAMMMPLVPAIGNETLKTTVTLAENDKKVWIFRGTNNANDTAALGWSSVDYVSAGRMMVTPQACVELSSGAGACVEICSEGFGDLGKGVCSGSNACQLDTQNGVFLCEPTGTKAVGEVCNVNAFNECADGSFCAPRGLGTGVCQSFCQEESRTNDQIGCTMDQVCRGSQCSYSCTSTNNADTTCPDNLQSCYEAGFDEKGNANPTFCSPSGMVAAGMNCNTDSQNCAPGLFCGHDQGPANTQFLTPQGGLSFSFLIPGLIGPQGSTPTCRTVECNLFPAAGQPSGCPMGQACYINPQTFSNTKGICMTADPALAMVAPLGNCPQTSIGQLCSDATICADIQGQASACVKLCDANAAMPCAAGQSCIDLLQGIGVCLPQQ